MKTSARISLAAAAVVTTTASLPPMAHADSQIDRGKYLVTLGGCNDCHTPGYFFGKPDMAQYLGGSDVAFEIPGLGAFPGRNITPDKETGIGNWTLEQIVAAVQIGKRPDGRALAPIMPWHAFANLTADDVFHTCRNARERDCWGLWRCINGGHEKDFSFVAIIDY